MTPWERVLLGYLANKGSCWLVPLLLTRWRRRRKGYKLTTVAKAALLVDNMEYEYGGKYESFTLLRATKDGCKIF